MKDFEYKDFDIETETGLTAAERYKELLNSKYETVEVKTISLYRIRVIGRISQ